MSPRFATVVAALALAACTAGAQGVPEGKLAAVGEVAFGPEDVAGVQAQLGAYAQLRFGGEGAAALLLALVDAEVLAQEALAQGLGDDPRIWYAVLEELAALHLAAELERRVPRAEVAADRAALQAAYDADPRAFAVPERRAAAGVVFGHWRAAEDALAAVQAGTVALESFGPLVTTPLQPRDDHESRASIPRCSIPGSPSAICCRGRSCSASACWSGGWSSSSRPRARPSRIPRCKSSWSSACGRRGSRPPRARCSSHCWPAEPQGPARSHAR
ncbi:MAG: hypothetical protein U0168_10570 [Nannocystaceae bacterium]